jgi:hypothetical protein
LLKRNLNQLATIKSNIEVFQLIKIIKSRQWILHCRFFYIDYNLIFMKCNSTSFIFSQLPQYLITNMGEKERNVRETFILLMFTCLPKFCSEA